MPCNNRFGDRSFAVAGPRLWNSLPISLRQISSFGQFRRYIKNHLFGIWEITAQCDAWFSALYKYFYFLTYLLTADIKVISYALYVCTGGRRVSWAGVIRVDCVTWPQVDTWPPPPTTRLWRMIAALQRRRPLRSSSGSRRYWSLRYVHTGCVALRCGVVIAATHRNIPEYVSRRRGSLFMCYVRGGALPQELILIKS